VAGIGLEIARHLAQRHASKLIFAVRNIKSGAEAREVIFSECHNDASLDIEVWQVDMSSVASVKAFADRCATLDRIDGVALNAGVMGGGDMAKTVDGNEEV
jgi:NAD(P)-dependent dehydrogenase (short-subunit alcohol dehydrogenase family)